MRPLPECFGDVWIKPSAVASVHMINRAVVSRDDEGNENTSGRIVVSLVNGIKFEAYASEMADELMSVTVQAVTEYQ